MQRIKISSSTGGRGGERRELGEKRGRQAEGEEGSGEGGMRGGVRWEGRGGGKEGRRKQCRWDSGSFQVLKRTRLL